MNVGKSNIIRRIFGKDFQEMEATIGVEFGFIDVTDVDPEDPNVILTIQIWDTCNVILFIKAGAERYRAITTSHIRNADGAFLVFDVTSENSFLSLDFWYDCITKSTNEDIVIYLIGNKCDLEIPGGIPSSKAIEFIQKYKLDGYGECSAKENININETFRAFYKSKCYPHNRHIHF